jgi:phosphomannomutase
VTASEELLSSARAWVADDPDPATREELEQLTTKAASGSDESAEAELADRFAGRLRFGTAGLRGAVAAGPNRMNRAIVRTATAALASWLASNRPGSRSRGVVIGCDARHGSAEFTEEAASVLAGAGFRVHLLEPQRPTPLLAFAVRHLGTAAGVMVTASHNPPADNGYKLYLEDGAQIVPPTDSEIESLMEQVGPLGSVRLADTSGSLVTRHGPEVLDAFLSALVQESPAPAGSEGLRIVYTPMHGVAGDSFVTMLSRAGFAAAILVPDQASPDPDFPTVAFPNPEEPGALDLALELARSTGADIVIANDPDGDRLAVAVPDPDAEGGWRTLTGDQVGALLGAYLLEQRRDDPRAILVATSIVSSTMLSRIAASAGARYAETLTGFKWLARAADAVPGAHLLFAYEEALGYSVGAIVRDKDGLGAALAFLGLAVRAGERGQSVLDELDELETRHGVHLTAQMSLRSEHPEASMTELRGNPPREFAGRAVLSARDLSTPIGDPAALPPADVLVYQLDGSRIVVRPSGTEPKLKIYFEVVRELSGGELAEARIEAGAELSLLRSALSSRLGT